MKGAADTVTRRDGKFAPNKRFVLAVKRSGSELVWCLQTPACVASWWSHAVCFVLCPSQLSRCCVVSSCAHNSCLQGAQNALTLIVKTGQPAQQGIVDRRTGQIILPPGGSIMQPLSSFSSVLHCSSSPKRAWPLAHNTMPVQFCHHLESNTDP